MNGRPDETQNEMRQNIPDNGTDESAGNICDDRKDSNAVKALGRGFAFNFGAEKGADISSSARTTKMMATTRTISQRMTASANL